MYHIGDVYFTSLFVNIICKSNEHNNFYYCFIHGDVFFKNISNIKNICPIKNNYNRNLINGQPPENLIHNDILNILLNNNMCDINAKIIQINDENILFVNTHGKCLEFITDYNFYYNIRRTKTLVDFLNVEFNLTLECNINYFFDNPLKIIEHFCDYNDFHQNVCENINECSFNDSIFIFNYVPRSLTFECNPFYDFIVNLSKKNKLILATYNKLFDDNPNVTFIDKKYNIHPDPNCENLIKIWNIAIKCKNVILLPTGSSWTFLHKLHEIKENQLYIYNDKCNDTDYCDKLNNNISFLLNKKMFLIQRAENYFIS